MVIPAGSLDKSPPKNSFLSMFWRPRAKPDENPAKLAQHEDLTTKKQIKVNP